jgi:uncharacterized repeat protein (TIGR03803 family)
MAAALAMFASPVRAHTWTETVLHSFAGGSDGAYPFGGVIADKAGNLFGTTSQGGGGCRPTRGCGTVFELAPDGTETVLHAFASGKDGNRPVASLVSDKKGNLYGTAAIGGNYNSGTVFKVNRTGVYKQIYAFTGGSDGAGPDAPLIFDGASNLYGTALTGGSSTTACNGTCGTIFKITTKGAFTSLYDFQGGSDGEAPAAPLILDAAGNLYGATIQGGSTGCGGKGCGTVFRLAADGTETVLHAFSGGNDGWVPESNLILDSAGNLYGTTALGGGDGCQGAGCGTVFEIAADGSENIISEFNTVGGPAGPQGAIIMGKNGDIFGTAGGGDAHCGTVFEISPGQQAKAIYSFTCGADGASPEAGLIKGANGVFYGTTEFGGDSGDGTVFSIQK